MGKQQKVNLGGYGSDASVCHSCGAPVLWCRFPDGKDRPVEDCPINVVGNIAIQPPLFGGTKIEARKVSTRTAYRMHSVSCPQAEDWRCLHDSTQGRTRHQTSETT